MIAVLNEPSPQHKIEMRIETLLSNADHYRDRGQDELARLAEIEAEKLIHSLPID